MCLADAPAGDQDLLAAAPGEVEVLCAALAPYRDELRNPLWAVVASPPKGKETQRLRAACALAAYDPASPHWATLAGPTVDQLVAENPVFLGTWGLWSRLPSYRRTNSD